jgi:hypothetical protein
MIIVINCAGLGSVINVFVPVLHIRWPLHNAYILSSLTSYLSKSLIGRLVNLSWQLGEMGFELPWKDLVGVALTDLIDMERVVVEIC